MGAGHTGCCPPGNTRLFGKLFFLVQSHLLSVRLASPALNPEHWQESSASSAAPHQHPSPPKAHLRAAPPAPAACSGQPGHCLCPAPAVAAVALPSRTRGLGTEAWLPASLALWGAGQGWDLRRLYRRNYKGADFPTDASIAALRKCVSRGGPPASWCFGELTGTAHTVFNN